MLLKSNSRDLVCYSVFVMLLSRRALLVSAFQHSSSNPLRHRHQTFRPLLDLFSASPTSRSSSSSSDKSKKKYVPEIPPLQKPSSFPSWSYEPRDYFRYELIYQSKISNARVGRIHTPHGVIDTPGFVAVATNGALKGLDFRQADEAGQQLVFCNSYHLLLQPGPEVIEGEQ